MKKFIIGIIVLSFFLNSHAQQKEDTLNKKTDTLVIQTEQSNLRKNEYMPRIFSILKTDFEWNTETGKKRFVLRNARLGIRGNLSQLINYQMELDLSDDGVFRVLNAFAVVKPIQLDKHALSFWVGYQKPFFSTEYLRNPMQIFFATRSMVVSEMTAGIADIGVIANYSFQNDVLPFDVSIGVLNGMGFQNISFEKPNYNGRIRLFPMKGLRLVAEYYGGYNMQKNPLNTFGFECTYEYKSFFIEAEYIQRQVEFIDSGFTRKTEGLMAETYYKFALKKAGFIHSITPTLRWDMLGNQIFNEQLQLGRVTAGVNFGIDKSFLTAEIRLNYEKYFKHIVTDRKDMFILEMVVSI